MQFHLPSVWAIIPTWKEEDRIRIDYVFEELQNYQDSARIVQYLENTVSLQLDRCVKILTVFGIGWGRATLTAILPFPLIPLFLSPLSFPAMHSDHQIMFTTSRCKKKPSTHYVHSRNLTGELFLCTIVWFQWQHIQIQIWNLNYSLDQSYGMWSAVSSVPPLHFCFYLQSVSM